jgi:hypothetical protein
MWLELSGLVFKGKRKWEDAIRPQNVFLRVGLTGNSRDTHAPVGSAMGAVSWISKSEEAEGPGSRGLAGAEAFRRPVLPQHICGGLWQHRGGSPTVWVWDEKDYRKRYSHTVVIGMLRLRPTRLEFFMEFCQSMSWWRKMWIASQRVCCWANKGRAKCPWEWVCRHREEENCPRKLRDFTEAKVRRNSPVGAVILT